MNETEFDLTTVSTREMTSDSDNNTRTDKPYEITNRPSEVFDTNETEFNLTTVSARDNNTKTDKITNRHLATFGMNETEVEITTVSARETTGNSVNDTITDEITNRPVNETEVITTNYLPDTTRNDETETWCLLRIV